MVDSKLHMRQWNRRTVVKSLGLSAVGLVASRAGLAAGVASSSIKPFRGLFPIAASPFTPEDKLDLECLGNEVKFCNRGEVPGLIWPQIASGWTTLTTPERFAGAEALIAAGKGGRVAVVIGVQTQGGDTAGAVAFAKHAAKLGADAICSLPPDGDDAAVLEYYKTIGKATDLPLFVQTSGKMSVDLVAQMFRAIPTMRVVKDEAGDPLERVTELRAKTDAKVAVFAGKGVRQMMDEMRLGFTGFCPTMGLADIFQQAWELWEAGKKRESFDMFGRTQAFASILNEDRYILTARGVFKETTQFRPTPGMGNQAQAPLTEAEKKVVRDALQMYLKPYLRA